MTTINLRDFYPWCKEDTFVEITDEMLEAMKAADRQEFTYKRRTYRYKAHYNSIENECIIKPETPEEIGIREETEEILSITIGELTEAQQRRLKLHFFDGIRYRQIARMEGVTDGSISNSIESALKKLSKDSFLMYGGTCLPSQSPSCCIPRRRGWTQSCSRHLQRPSRQCQKRSRDRQSCA